eukprot:scaffold10558_cov111-Isochrysis_galbana.AAC.7
MGGRGRQHPHAGCGHAHILVISEDSTARPIEGAVEQRGVVNDGKLVVHVRVLVAVSAYLDARRPLELSHVRALAGGLLAVGDDPDADATPIGVYQSFGKLVARDSEDTDVDISFRSVDFSQQRHQRRLIRAVGVCALAPVAGPPLQRRVAWHGRVWEEYGRLLGQAAGNGDGQAGPHDRRNAGI